MISQAIRNIFNSQVGNLIKREQGNLENLAGDKILELKNKIPTPEEALSQLKTAINKEICSDKGQKKLRDKYDSLNNKLTKIENLLQGFQDKLEGIQNKINPILEESGPIGKVWEIVRFLDEKLKPILKAAVIIITATLAANVGLAASGSAISFLTKRQRDILGLVKEIAAIAIAVPTMIKYFKDKVKKLLKKLNPIINKLKQFKDFIVKIKLFAYGLLLQFENACNLLNETPNVSTTTTPSPTEDSTLNDYLNLMSNYYKDVYDALKAAGNQKAIERVYAIGKNLEEEYNISFKVINLQQ
tara:strand:- start:625 stop:1527 length:903 start_codon:yes stop_codon:yes gene_type:complete